MNTTLALAGAAAMVAMAIGMAGCSDRSAAESDGLAANGSKYCNAFKPAATNTNGGLAPPAADPAASFDDCIHRWAYTLAPDHDPADVVARASVDACSPLLTAWNQQTLGQQSPEPQRSGRTGQQSNPVAQRMGMVEARALFYVVQARAAHCAPPPANTLLTTAGATSGAGGY